MLPAQIVKIVRRMKGLGGDVKPLTFPIRDAEMQTIGRLVTVGEAAVADDSLIETMARCHTFNKGNFLSQFDVSPDNKRRWLSDAVLHNDAKVLFLVETHDGRVVGQDGFTLRAGDAMTLDGTMRWARGGRSELFLRSSFERTAMGFLLFGYRYCVAQIFRNNAFALRNIQALGLEERCMYRLRREEREGVVHYKTESDLSRVNTDETLLEFSIDRDSFIAANPELAQAYARADL